MPVAAHHAGLSWQELCEDPRFAFLDDLPFKVETNRWGQIVMSGTRFKHGFFQHKIGCMLLDLITEPGVSVTEPAVETPEGVKVADVGWFSAEHAAEAWEAFAVSRAPAICVEVLSPWNAWGEIEENIRLYLAVGAEEV